MTTAAHNPPSFPDEQQFDGTNYVNFKDRVLIAARLRGARGYLDGTIQKPSPLSEGAVPPGTTEWPDTSPSPIEWEMRDAWALALIVYNSKNPVGFGIKMGGTAAEAWKSLTEAYGMASELAAVGAEKTLRSTMYTDGGDFLAHLADLRTKWNQATEKGAKIDDGTFRTIVLASMPASWNTIVASIYTTKTSAEAIASMTIHWDRLVAQGATAGTTSTALQARATTQKPKFVCINSNCGRTGHTIENCYWKGGGKEGQFPANFRSRGRTDTTSSTTSTAVTPTAAPPTAKIANANPSANSTITYALLAQRPFSPIAFYGDGMIALEAKHEYATQYLSIADAYLSDSSVKGDTTAMRASVGEIQTYADSGASDHCFVDREAFEDYQELSTPLFGQSASRDGRFSIVGRGTVKKEVTTNGLTSQLSFRGALHTPDLSANLISIAKFDAAGFSVTFSNGQAIFRDPEGRGLYTPPPNPIGVRRTPTDS